MRKSLSRQIFEHALRFATPFSTPNGQPWAIVPDGPARYNGWPIRSLRFREWLAYSFHHELEIFPGESSLRVALGMLSAQARHSEFPVSEVFTRLGWRGSRLNPAAVLLHLANPAGEIVEITPGGHRIVPAQAWRFLAAASTAPLPRPVDTSATLLEQLEPLLGIHGPALHRAAIWLFAALRPAGPYPTLWLTGPPAGGKSTIARILRSLIDPSAAPLLIPPSSPSALFSLALHNRVLAFDQVSGLPRRTAGLIARLATGTAFALGATRVMDDPATITLERPVIITARDPMPPPAGTAIHVPLDAINVENVRPVAAIARSFDHAAPSILGVLCAAVSAALSNIATARIDAVSHIPDVHQWTLAAASVLGLSPAEINRALAANPLIDRIHALLEHRDPWTGTATELANELQFDGMPQHLSEQIAAIPLPLFGLQLERWQSHDTRRIRLTATPKVVVSKAAA